MKKSILICAALGVSLGAAAQVSLSPAVADKKDKTPATLNVNWKREAQPSQAANKEAKVGGSRWYSQFQELDANVYGGALSTNEKVIPIWFTPTILQNFTSGPDTVNYSAVGQVIDPITSTLFNNKANHKGEIQVTGSNSYVVDSVRFSAFYQRLSTRPASVVDTIVISVTANNRQYYWLRSGTSVNVTPYLPTGKDTLWAPASTRVDSINRAAFADDGTTRWITKIPLHAADTIFNQTFFTYAVNGSTGLTIPAGYRVAVTAAFKSGDTWRSGIDTMSNFNLWMPGTAEPVTGGLMPYLYYTYNDHSMSSMLFSTDSSFFIPSVVVEAVNTTAFRNEFHDIGVHISCATCNSLSATNINEEFTKFQGLPNPASTEFYVPFTLKSSANVTVSIANSLGQVVAVKSLGNTNNGVAKFDISSLANGVYFYTVNADGLKATDRFVVAH